MKSVNKFLLKVIITYRLLFVSEFIDFMISSEDVSASQRLKCSLDIFFLLGISLINSVVATVAVLYKKGVLKNFSDLTGKYLC